MNKLTCNKSGNGFPTKHRIKFKSRRMTIEGGGPSVDGSEREYDGVLFESTHFDTHLCVRVDREEHWSRGEDWHGYVYRDNVICVTLVDEAGVPVATENREQVADEDFLFAWGMLCNSLDPVASESPA